jgi:hypothetical protein
MSSPELLNAAALNCPCVKAVYTGIAVACMGKAGLPVDMLMLFV